jgi:FtsZ-binding cell division protein ZapB
MFIAKAERIDTTQLQLEFEELVKKLNALSGEQDKGKGKGKDESGDKPRGARESFPPHAQQIHGEQLFRKAYNNSRRPAQNQLRNRKITGGMNSVDQIEASRPPSQAILHRIIRSW